MTNRFVPRKDITIGNLARIYIIKEFIDMIILYNTTFRNPLSVILKNKLKKYSIEAILKNNDKKLITRSGGLLSLLYNFEYESNKDIVNLETRIFR